MNLEDWRNIDESLKETISSRNQIRNVTFFNNRTIEVFSPTESENLELRKEERNSSNLRISEIEPIESSKLGTFRRFIFQLENFSGVPIEGWKNLQQTPYPIANFETINDSNSEDIFILGGSSLANDLLRLNTISEQWISLEDIPIQFASAGASLLDNSIYIFGGQFNPNKGMQFNLDFDIWTYLPDLPESINKINVINDNERIYLLGGVIGSNPNLKIRQLIFDNLNQTSEEIYSTISQLESGWNCLFAESISDGIICLIRNGSNLELKKLSLNLLDFTDLTNPPFSLDPVGYFDQELKLGIFKENTTSSDLIYIYDQFINNWKNSGISIERYIKDFGMTAKEGKLYFIGGANPNYSRTSEVRTNSLLRIPFISYPSINQLSPAISKCGSVLINSKIWIIDSQINNRVLTFDLSSQQWTEEISSAFTENGESRSFFYRGKIYNFLSTTNNLEIWQIDPINKNTRKLMTFEKRINYGYLQIDNLIFILGGISASISNEFFVIDINNLSKKDLKPFPFENKGSQLLEFNGYIYVFGGQRSNEEFFKDIYRFSIKDNSWNRVASDSQSRIYGNILRIGHIGIRFTDQMTLYDLRNKAKMIDSSSPLIDSPRGINTDNCILLPLDYRIWLLRDIMSAKIIPFKSIPIELGR